LIIDRGHHYWAVFSGIFLGAAMAWYLVYADARPGDVAGEFGAPAGDRLGIGWLALGGRRPERIEQLGRGRQCLVGIEPDCRRLVADLVGEPVVRVGSIDAVVSAVDVSLNAVERPRPVGDDHAERAGRRRVPRRRGADG